MSRTPITDSMMRAAGDMKPGAVVIPVQIARELEDSVNTREINTLFAENRALTAELNTAQSAIKDAIGNIIERGGHEEWPIIKRLRATLKWKCDPVIGEDGKSLPHTTDARAWAKEWLKTIKSHPGVPHDEGTMITWFANAIMAGYDEAQMRFNPKSRQCITTDAHNRDVLHEANERARKQDVVD